MHYLDTSILAAILLRDPESERVEKALQGLGGEFLALSVWTGVEVFSAIARRLRMREISPREAARARQAYDEEFVAKHDVLVLTTPDYARARNLLAVDGTKLRAGDALHLAVALNHGVSTFRTLDKDLRKIAVQSGLTAPAI
ncbi:MAG: type II toxin-antitoxin system VapC family toxin [Nevskia sp.]|nr:type II toxin-antitoxin system VapC family toxin [Nevskia sp.]